MSETPNVYSDDEIERFFTTKSLSDDQKNRFYELNEAAEEFFKTAHQLMPLHPADSRNQALRHIQSATMWANHCIANGAREWPAGVTEVLR